MKSQSERVSSGDFRDLDGITINIAVTHHFDKDQLKLIAAAIIGNGLAPVAGAIVDAGPIKNVITTTAGGVTDARLP